MTKKYFADSGRGLTANQIEAIKFADAQAGNFLCGILSELKKPDAEIFIGIRNGCFNLYLGGASIGKFDFDCGRVSSVEIHKKYLGENAAGYAILPAENAAWYCVDIEYAMQRRNKAEADFGRADVIAISRRPIGGKYKLLMIELKVGAGSFGTDAKNFPREKMTAAELLGSDKNFGSGIFGHFADFVRYAADKNYDCGGGFRGRFTKLRGEVVNILENYSALGILPALNLALEDISDEPALVFRIFGDAERSFRHYVCGKSARAIVKACDENFVAEVFNKNIKCVFGGDLILNLAEATHIF